MGFYNMFSESSPYLLWQHGSCSSTELLNLFTKSFSQFAVTNCKTYAEYAENPKIMRALVA